jgi:hypothetical protein
MTKLIAPLGSHSASGSIAGAFTYSNRKSGAQVRFQKKQKDVITEARTEQRELYSSAVAGWNDLTDEEKDVYKNRAKNLQMSGYNLYIKENISTPTPPPPEPVILTFLQEAGSSADLTEYTFPAQNFGSPATDRVILLTLMTRSTLSTELLFNSVTIGGVLATIHIQRTTGGLNPSATAIVSALVPAGTTGDIVVTMNRSTIRMQLGVYRVTGLIDHTTAYDSASDVASPITASLDVPAGGFIVGCVCSSGNSSFTITWVNLIQDFRTDIENFMPASGASKVFELAQTELAVSATFNGGSQFVGAFVSF